MTSHVCPDCGASIEPRARVCPRCKGRLRPKLGVLGKLAITLLVLIAIGVGVVAVSPQAGL